MKIVIINHSDTRGGASVVSYRLMNALRRIGEDASMLVVHKSTDNPNVIRTRSARIPFLEEHLRIFLGNGFDRSDLFKVSVASDGLPLHRHPLVREADAVCLGWINQGMLSLGEIGRIAATGKKIVWTMHDMWNLTGICHHAGDCTSFRNNPGCGNCPFLHSCASDRDMSRKTWERKKALYDSTGIRFVAVSHWLASKCAESSLLREADVRVIPNAFPVEEFYLTPRRSRQELGLPDDKKIILMGAARLDDPVKGLDYAVDTLNRLTDTDAYAVFFGSLRNPAALDGLRLPYRHLGPVSDPETLHELYAHASVVLSTSLYETLPGTLIEGQAAGCIPASFDRGGQADIISDETLGILVPFGDTEALAAGIRRALNEGFDPERLRTAVGRFSSDCIAREYLKNFVR